MNVSRSRLPLFVFARSSWSSPSEDALPHNANEPWWKPPAPANPAPSVIATVDYFFNTASPVSPEDGPATTTTTAPPTTTTTTPGSQSGVTYVRDVTDRVIERRVNGAVVARYAYSGGGDSPDATLDATNTVIESTIPLLGGALLTIRPTSKVWSYPNIHGDVMATADGQGSAPPSSMTPMVSP